MAFNLILEFCVVRHNHSWQHRPIPERLLSTKDTPLGACLLDKTGLWARNCPYLNYWQIHGIWKWINRTVKSCQDRVRWFWNLLPVKNNLSVILGLSQSWLLQCCKQVFGDCPGSQLSLWFVACFGSSLIALPNYSGNIISLLGSSMGLKTR